MADIKRERLDVWVRNGDLNDQGDLMAICIHSHIFTKCLVCLFLQNTHAARKSRLKKFLKVEFLEKQVSALQAENSKLVLRTAVLDSEKQSMLAKEQEYIRRIKHLEDIVNKQQQKLNDTSDDSSPHKWLV